MALNFDIQPFLDAINKLSDAEKVTFNQIIWKDYVEAAPITNYHSISAGIKCKDPIPYGDRQQTWNFGKNASGLTSQCDEILTDVDASISLKEWDPATYTNAFEICFEDLECKFKDYMNSEKCNEADPRGTQFWNFVMELLGENVTNSHWPKTYFAAKTSTDTSLNGHDGIFVQYLAAAPTTNTKQRIVIAENAGADYATQDNLGLTTGYDTFNAMYQLLNGNRVLRRKSGLKIKTTYDLAANYLFQLQRDKQLNCCERDMTTEIYTVDNLNIYGVPIEIVYEWDDIIRAVDSTNTPVFSDLNDGTRYIDPHRAVLTYNENEPIGTCDSGELGELRVVYDDYTRKTKASMKYDFDVKLIRDEDFILAM